MQRTWCDNCGIEIKEEADEVNKDNPDWKPDMRGEIRIRLSNSGRTINEIHMDCCGKCTRLYIRRLKEPLE